MKPDRSGSPRGRVGAARVVAGLLALILSFATAISASEEMMQFGEPPLIVHASPERARLGADLARRGPSEVARISRALGLEPPARIDTWLLPRKGAEQPGSFGLPAGPEWASGLALRDRPVIILRTDEEGGEAGNEVATTMSHELVHAIMSGALRGSPGDVPAWWEEGVAAHLAYEWRLVQSVHVVGLALSGSFVPLSQIEDIFPVGGPRVQWAYLESFAFLSWLDDRSGPDAIGVVHQGLLEGKSFRAAFIDAYGESPTRLEEEWKGQFLWRYRWIPILTSSSTLWGVIMVAFAVVGVAKRREATRRLAAWEDEGDVGTEVEAEAGEAPDPENGLEDDPEDDPDEEPQAR